jgi:hypothetical protein
MTIKRVIVAPLNYSHRQEGQIEAFEEVFGKENVREFDYMARRQDANAALVALASEFKPDWIWLQVQGTEILTPGGLTRVRQVVPQCLITHWMGDARVEVSPALAAMCHATDATLISSVGQTAMYRGAGARRVEYVQIGLDYRADVLGEPEWTPPFEIPPVVFCGAYYGHVPAFEEGTRQRLSAIRALVNANCSVGVVGSGWPSDVPVVGACHVKQQHHVYRRARVALSINHFNNIERYYSDRQLIAMASGTPVVARYVPGLECEFGDGEHCLWWKDEKQLVEQVCALLEDSERANKIGAQGRQKVIAEHTWTARLRGLRSTVETWESGTHE